MATVNGYTAEHMLEIENATIVDGEIVGSELILTKKSGSLLNLGKIVEAPNSALSEIVILGKTEFGSAKEMAETSTGERVEILDISNLEFQPGMGPFFSQVLPDGTIAMPQIPLTINQVNTTGKNMSMAFWSVQESAFYTVIVPTSMGEVETLAVNTITGIEQPSGGADLSDCALVYVDDVPVLYGLSALPYRGWDVEAYGVYPVLPAFVKSEATGRWVYSEELSLFAEELQISDPTNGQDSFPNTENYFGQTVAAPKLMSEIAALPQSNHLAIAIYGLKEGSSSGAVIVVDPEARSQKAYYEFPDFSSQSGASFKAFTRDLNTDPTSELEDERIVLNFDTFTQPNEIFNIVVNAASGTWRVVWDEDPSDPIDVGASAREVLEALEGIPGIGAGNVRVHLTRPFLVSTYSVYEVHLVGDFQFTDMSAIDIAFDATSLVTNNSSHITRWQTGGTNYSKHAPFPMVEMSYDSLTGELTQLTDLMVPHDSHRFEDMPESLDARFSMTWIDSEGTLWVTVHGTNANPEATTSFSFWGLHAWRKEEGERRYVTDHALSVDWQEHFGEAQPWPDLMTDGLHDDNNFHALAISEDPASGGIIASATNGKIKLAQPTVGLVNRTDNLFGTTEPSTWTIVSGGSHSGSWDGGEEAFILTAGSDESMLARSPTGLDGIPIPAEYEGQQLQVEIDVKADSVNRENSAVVYFYDSDGDEIELLSGFGPAYIYSNTTDYTKVIGSSVIPEGTRFISVGVLVRDPGSGEDHLVNSVDAYISACYPVDDIHLDTDKLYDNVDGNVVVAKGFVDPDTRRLWLPFLQSMSQPDALNTVHSAWLIGLDLVNKLRDRRAIAAREPISHAETHAVDGSDPLFGDVVFNRQTDDYTAKLTDRGKIVEMDKGSANDFTVPPHEEVPLPIKSKIGVTQRGAGLTTIVEGSGVTVNSLGGLLDSAGRYSRIWLEKVGLNEWYAYGDLA